MQLFDSLTIPEQTTGNFFVHTRLTLIDPLDEEGAESLDSQDNEFLASPHQAAEADSETCRGFLDNLMACGSCRQPMTYNAEWRVYQADHLEDCPHLKPVSAFQVESLISSELKKMVTPQNVAASLRYQEKLRTQRQSERNRLRHELEMLRSQVKRHFRYRTHGHLISSHQEQLHSALEKANQRRITYLESALEAWVTGPQLLDEGDALALCLLAKDFENIWSYGTRVTRRRIVSELLSKVLLFPSNDHCQLEYHWKIYGLEHRGEVDLRAS